MIGDKKEKDFLITYNLSLITNKGSVTAKGLQA